MRRIRSIAVLGIACSAGWSLCAQPSFYGGTNITGQLVLTRTVNALQEAQLAQQGQFAGALSVAHARFGGKIIHPELLPKKTPLLRAPLAAQSFAQASPRVSAPSVPTQYLNVNPSGSFGFMGLTHYDERNANGGNQFSIEPPSQGLAVANGYVVEGVNNAFQVYSMSGTPLLPAVISTNQLFGVSPAINRSFGTYGVYPTDIRVFYDQSINRWIVLQRVQDNDIFDDPLNTSHIYMAVSQTGDPTGTYNIYVIETTNSGTLGCPCVSDYPSIGADQYGFYISSNEYVSNTTQLVDASILAISKASLVQNAVTPTVVDFHIPFSSGFEFTIHPATTPFGASYFVGGGGLEYFVSSQGSFSFSNNLAVWAMTNTSSLAGSPSMLLTQITIPTLAYSVPDLAKQRPGTLTYGSTLTPPGLLAFIDPGDSRIQSVAYSGGRLYTTLVTQVVDQNGHQVVGGAYVVISPTYRGALSASVVSQGFLVVNGDHILRPAIAVNPKGNGAIVFTLLGPDYYPSAAFVPVTGAITPQGFTVSPAAALQVAAPGVGPEDGFTGYPDIGVTTVGIARWGDYSMAVAASDGSIWMGTEYIPNAPRTQFANWGTFITRYTP